MTAQTVDLNACYRVAGYRGVAFRLAGWAIETVEPEPILVCTEGDCAGLEHTEDCWAWPEESETVESQTTVRAVMVGDDREHLVDVDDLTVLPDDDYCAVCGQIGCTQDGRSS